MPRYLIAHPPDRQREDIFVEDPALHLEFADGWAVLSDSHGPCLAVPISSGVTIQRIDPNNMGQQTEDDTSEGPAPQE